MAEPRSHPHSFLIRQRFSPWVVALAGLVVFAGLFLEGRKTALDDFRAKFEEHAAAHAGIMVQEMDEGILILKSVDQFCQEGHVAGREFSAFAVPLLRQHRQLGSVGWVPRVAGESAPHMKEWHGIRVPSAFASRSGVPIGLKSGPPA